MQNSQIMAKDPVCGMEVDTASALKTELNGKMYYFCSESCRQKFLASPNDYVKKAGSAGGCCCGCG